jgi:hypothetical protein
MAGSQRWARSLGYKGELSRKSIACNIREEYRTCRAQPLFVPHASSAPYQWLIEITNGRRFCGYRSLSLDQNSSVQGVCHRRGWSQGASRVVKDWLATDDIGVQVATATGPSPMPKMTAKQERNRCSSRFDTMDSPCNTTQTAGIALVKTAIEPPAKPMIGDA